MNPSRFSALPLLVALVLPLMTAACGLPLAVTAVSYGADGISLATTQKSGADHLASMASKKDCAIWRMFRNIPICKEREDGRDPYDVDYNTPDRMVSEAGIEYQSPPRYAIDAPATSWDAAAYNKPAPAPLQPAAEPVTAVAEAPAAEVAPPAALPPHKVAAHPKKTAAAKSKAKARPVAARKPSPDQAASRL